MAIGANDLFDFEDMRQILQLALTAMVPFAFLHIGYWAPYTIAIPVLTIFGAIQFRACSGKASLFGGPLAAVSFYLFVLTAGGGFFYNFLAPITLSFSADTSASTDLSILWERAGMDRDVVLAMIDYDSMPRLDIMVHMFKAQQAMLIASTIFLIWGIIQVSGQLSHQGRTTFSIRIGPETRNVARRVSHILALAGYARPKLFKQVVLFLVCVFLAFVPVFMPMLVTELDSATSFDFERRIELAAMLGLILTMQLFAVLP